MFMVGGRTSVYVLDFTLAPGGSLLIVSANYVTFALYVINALKPTLLSSSQRKTFTVPARHDRELQLFTAANVERTAVGALRWTSADLCRSTTKTYRNKVFKRSVNGCQMMNRVTL